MFLSPYKTSRRQYRHNIVVADIEVDILDKVADKVADMVADMAVNKKNGRHWGKPSLIILFVK